MGLLKDGLAALGHAARRRSLAQAVYGADDGGVVCSSLMAAIMLQNRDNELPVPLATRYLVFLSQDTEAVSTHA